MKAREEVSSRSRMGNSSNTIKIAAALLALATAGATSAADKVVRSHSSSSSKSVQWKPEPFSVVADRLPANYLGTPTKKFFPLFATKVSQAAKKEFETTDEFARRMADRAEILSPIDPGALYAFKAPSITATYDADKGEYKISGFDCEDARTSSREGSWVTCKLGEIERKHDAYIGGNKYGATVRVRRTVGQNAALAFQPGKSKIDTWLTPRLGYSVFGDTIEVPIDKAKALHGNRIGLLLVGRVAEIKVIPGRSIFVEATYSEPYDVHITTQGMPFELTGLVYYVVETGEILARK